MQETKLFCFPFAGGSANVFQGWQKFFPPEIKIIAVEPSGRGKRFGTPPFETMGEIVFDLFNQIKNEAQDGDYAFFGHSMGAIIAHELAYLMRESGVAGPRHLFLSGEGAPHLVDKSDIHQNTYLLSDAELKDKLRYLGVTPKEVLDNPQMMDVFLPILRADFKACNLHTHQLRNYKLDCPMTIFCGTDDYLTDSQLAGWEMYTIKEVEVKRYKGGHFYLYDHLLQVVRFMARTLYMAREAEVQRSTA